MVVTHARGREDQKRLQASLLISFQVLQEHRYPLGALLQFFLSLFLFANTYQAIIINLLLEAKPRMKSMCSVCTSMALKLTLDLFFLYHVFAHQ
jgi:hypothetical protein